jgi:Holliday junction DNA helicase RuvA
LYGFVESHERLLFRLLIKLNGVGPKMALGILSGLTIHELANCVRRDDVNSLVRLPGVGKKTAERLIVELRDKLTDWYQEETEEKAAVPAKAGSAAYREAEEALIALGYKPQDAGRAVSRAGDR